MKFHLKDKEFSMLHFFGAVFTLVGSIIGAGILGIPYVMAKAGFWTGIFILIAITLVFLLLYLYLGEAILRTPGNHQLPGLAGIYLNKPGKITLFISMMLVSYSSMIAYLIAAGDALVNLFSGYFQLTGIFAYPVFYSTIIFLGFAALLFRGLNILEDSELLITSFLIISIIIIFGLSLGKIDVANFSGFNYSMVFYPYGAIFFAFMGFMSLPESVNIVKERKRLVPLVLITAVVLTAVIYLIFSTTVIGVMGTNVNELATIGLEKIIGPEMFLIGNLFLLFSVSTSFLAVAFALKDTFEMDYKMCHMKSWLLSTVVAFVAFIVVRNYTSFIRILDVAGAVFGGIMVSMIVLLSFRAKIHGTRKPEYCVPMNGAVVVVLLGLLIVGIITTLI